MTVESFHMRTELHRLRALGLSFPVAMGVSIDATERVHGRRYDWRKSFKPSDAEERIIKSCTCSADSVDGSAA